MRVALATGVELTADAWRNPAATGAVDRVADGGGGRCF